MHIYIDADAFAHTKSAEKIAQKYNIPVTLLCDTNHILTSDYSEIKVIGAGSDAVDFALVNLCKKGDIVATQDYGLAAMVLAKQAYCIHPTGRWYTKENMDQLLLERHITKEIRRSSKKNHLKGPKKKTPEDTIRFEQSFEKLIQVAIS